MRANCATTEIESDRLADGLLKGIDIGTILVFVEESFPIVRLFDHGCGKV